MALACVALSAAGADAASWSLQTSPNPTGGTGNTLRSVSCPTTTSCVAAGQYTSGRAIVTLAEHWSEGTWSIKSTPSPGSGVDPLLAVSCTASTACTATGSSSSRTAPIAERWNGTSWALQRTQERAVTNLEGVACFSAEGCVAVGTNNPGALSEHWNGSAWATHTVPAPPDPFGEGFETSTERLTSVSCTSSTFCLAVGSYSVTVAPGFSIALPLAEAWNGTAWEAKSTPPMSEYSLQEVSCTSARSCTAVGQTGTTTLALAWNGTEWAVQTTPSVGTSSILNSVSCVSSTSCTAVGYSNNGGIQTLAMHWDGSRWSTQTIPNPGRGGIVNGISCPSTTICTAVGHYTEASGVIDTMALRYA